VPWVCSNVQFRCHALQLSLKDSVGICDAVDKELEKLAVCTHSNVCPAFQSNNSKAVKSFVPAVLSGYANVQAFFIRPQKDSRAEFSDSASSTEDCSEGSIGVFTKEVPEGVGELRHQVGIVVVDYSSGSTIE